MIYLLTKTTIERGARTISQLKILGYRDREINALYLRTITLTVVASLLASQALIIHTLRWVLEWAFMHYEVNFVLEVPTRMLLILALFHFRQMHECKNLDLAIFGVYNQPRLH